MGLTECTRLRLQVTARLPRGTCDSVVVSGFDQCNMLWLSIALTLCHILHSVSHWPVLVYYLNMLYRYKLLTAAVHHVQGARLQLGIITPVPQVLLVVAYCCI
jgi:hypothetical protein